MPTVSIGLFIDKGRRPTDAQLSEAIGPRIYLWQAIVRSVRERYAATEEFRFMYGKKYGWALRFRMGEKLLASLYPTQGGFTAQVILNRSALKIARNMKLGRHVQEAIARSHPYPEGRWLFIPIESKKGLRDFQRLMELRAGLRSKTAGHSGRPVHRSLG
jgi:hypothetical protein